jgi:hypothetical protein
MKAFLKGITICSLVLLGACSTNLNKSQPSSSIAFNVRSDMAADVDVDMNTVLKGQAKETVLLGIKLKTSHTYLDGVMYGGGEGGNSGLLSGLFSDSTVDRAKSAAAYDALRKEKDVDVLVGARYIIQQKRVFFGAYKEIVVSVSGYAGRIKKIRNANK